MIGIPFINNDKGNKEILQGNMWDLYHIYICSKISNTKYTFFSKFSLSQFFIYKMLTGIANSEDPGQTAPSGAVWPGSALFACPILPVHKC